VNGRLTKIEMLERGKNTLDCQNHHKKMKVPYVICADFEALVRKVQCCEHTKGQEVTYIEKTE